VDPKGSTPAVAVETEAETVWQVQWDNPVVGGLYDLPYGEINGFAKRVDPHWEYNKFDLEMEVSDADGTRRLYTWPEFYGTYGDDELSFPFEAHGMKLLPGVDGDPFANLSQAVAYAKQWNLPELPVQDALGNSVGQFRLDPAVGLVPLRVVVAHGAGLSAPGFSPPAMSPGWFPSKDAEVLFDDGWVGDKFTNTEPGLSPDHVVTSWKNFPGSGQVAKSATSGSGTHLQPDRIFDECGVQFRMVSFDQCEVPADLLYQDVCPGGFEATAQITGLRNYVHDECGVPEDGTPVVIFTGSLSRTDCVNQIRGGEFNGTVAVSRLATDKKTLAHELGHVLNLADILSPGTGNLMSYDFNAIDLTQEQCQTANAAAKKHQVEYWPDSNPAEGLPKQSAAGGQEASQEFLESMDEEQTAMLIDLVGMDVYEQLVTIVEGKAWGLQRYAIINALQPHEEALMELMNDEQWSLFEAMLEEG